MNGSVRERGNQWVGILLYNMRADTPESVCSCARVVMAFLLVSVIVHTTVKYKSFVRLCNAIHRIVFCLRPLHAAMLHAIHGLLLV